MARTGQDHNEYLAIHVLNESETVNYRMLARAIKVHHNRAKQFLHEFYERQNKKTPGSLAATYLVTGRNIIPVTDSSQHSTNGTFSQPTDPTASQDSPPQSSAPAPSQDANDKSKTSTPGPTYSKRVLIVSSTNLEKAKATFDIVDSEHIYALSPNPLKDLRVLAECNRQVTSKYSNEDPLETWSSTYGVIRNENVWRRTRGGMPVSVPAPASKVVNDAPADSKPSLKKAESKREESIDEEPSKDRKTIGTDKEAQPIDNKPAKTTTQKHPPTLKKESSSIMASFAKTRPAAEKKEVEKDKDTAQSDEDLIGDDDDDDENDDGMDIDERTKEQDEAIKKKEEREAKLRDMMDMDDESDTNKEKSKMDENEDVDMPDISQTSQSQQNISQDTVNEQADTNTGRKRGKRRVMKKKTVKDEEGYLVTKEEAVWESFSEDETLQHSTTNGTMKKGAAAPSPFAAAAAAKSNNSSTSAAKKTVAKGGKGGGGIMSFFAKK